MNHAFLIRLCKKRAKRRVMRQHLYLPLFLLCIFIFLAFVGIAFGAWFLMPISVSLSQRVALSLAATAMGTILLLAPLWCGVENFLFQKLLSDNVGISRVFHFFTNIKLYFFAVRRALSATLRFALCFFCLTLMQEGLQTYLRKQLRNRYLQHKRTY